jgi:hypothetical protein
MDPYTFVRNLTANRRVEQASALPAPDPAHLSLHPDLRVAIRHSFFIQPVLAEQISRHSLAGVPDCEPAVIAAWIAEHKGCNFALSLEQSGVFALQIEPYQSLDAIAWLLHRDGRQWQHTLQFKSGHLHYALFDRPAPESRNLSTSLPGLAIISRGSLLIPPSVGRRGVAIRYAARDASILEAPSSLFSAPAAANPEIADLPLYF